jgi:hypothetical protein
LADECQLEVSDSVLSKLVHDHLQAQLKVARPQALEQSPSALQQFRTTLKPALQALPELVGPTPTVRYVCQDESRFGLHTVSGRVMTLKGVKPVGRCQWPRDNFYVYGIVEPLTGEYFIEKRPKLNGETFQMFIDALAKKYCDSIIVMQLDRASCHRSKQIDWPENLLPILQPAHAPELNPLERLWQYVKRPLRGQNYKNLEQLWQQIQDIFHPLTAEVVRSLTGWDFIVDAVLSATS